MARKLTGSLVEQKRGFCARVPQIVEGVRVKPIYFLGTHSRPLAKRRMARVIADLEAGKVLQENDAARSETFAEVAARVNAQRALDGVKSAKAEMARMRAYALPTLGSVDVTKIEAALINEALDECMELIRFPGHLAEQVGSGSPEHGETEEAIQRGVQA